MFYDVLSAIDSFEGRVMKVRIYKNLANGLLSLMDPASGLVVGHCNSAFLTDVSFRVSEAGRKRVLRLRQKNVHAFVEGEIQALGGFVSYKGRSPELVKVPTTPILLNDAKLLARIRYNPYEMSEFQTTTGHPVKGVPLCRISSEFGILGYAIVNNHNVLNNGLVN